MSQTKVEAPFVENNRPFRNIIINGDMSISQRGTSFASMGNVDSQYTLDRWKFTEEGDFGAAEITVTQDTDVPTGEGFAKSLKCVCATVDTSIDSGTISYMEQRIEGQNLQHVSKGTSGAKKMTYSFFCKSNLTGTFTINFLDSDNTRQFSTSYSLASANTWERIIINIPADTTGAFTNDNGDSLIVQMNLQAGTSKSNGALTTAFEASAQGDRGVGQTNFFSSTSNNWYITGCQLEVGDQATDFEHLPFDVQLQRCKRYYYQVPDVATSSFRNLFHVHAQSATYCSLIHHHPVSMRAAPTATEVGSLVISDGTANRSFALSTNYSTTQSLSFDITTSSFANTPQGGTVANGSSASNYLTVDSEL